MGFKLDPREIGWAPYVMIGGGLGLGTVGARDHDVPLSLLIGRPPVAAGYASPSTIASRGKPWPAPGRALAREDVRR